MKIVVLAGGYSPERDVSLSSGSLIANALMENGHQVLLLDLYLGTEEANACYRALPGGERYAYQIPASAPDLAELQRESGNGNCLIGKNVLSICQKADLVFIALHGAMGENGQIQAVFDAFGIPYTGSGYAGCLLAMDKFRTKQLMPFYGVPTPPGQLICLSGTAPDLSGVSFPCVVKPCSCGSSVGVSLVDTPEQLQKALEDAAHYEDSILIEEKITGREFSVGVLEGKALPPIEIIPVEGFYDYKNKYQAGLTREICPAQAEESAVCRMQEAALALHQGLGLGSYSRTDFLMNEKGELFCLEVNTLPGMTPASLLPQEAAAAGISYNALCQKIVDAALK